MAAHGDDDTARKVRSLADYNAGSGPDQHLPSVQRTHAGFQQTLSPPGGDHQQPSQHAAHQQPGQPHNPVHHQPLPPMVDPQLGGGGLADGHSLPPLGRASSNTNLPAMPSHIQHLLQHPEDDNLEKKGRQLSNTKRAAQNRAAQRAFRQRKEVHIKNLEAKVKELETVKLQNKILTDDNYSLRGYLITMLEMCAKKGLEPPPGMPSMQILQQGPPVPPIDTSSPPPNSAGAGMSGSQSPPDHNGASTHLHHESGNGSVDSIHDHEMKDMSRAPDPPSGMRSGGQDGPTPNHQQHNQHHPHEAQHHSQAPTAPMQNIAQQAMDHGGPGQGVRRLGLGTEGVNTKIDPQVTGA